MVVLATLVMFTKLVTVSKAQLLVVPALCGNWWVSKLPELVDTGHDSGRGPCLSAPGPCCRDSTAELGRCKSRFFSYETGEFLYNTFTPPLIGLWKREPAILLVSSHRVYHNMNVNEYKIITRRPPYKTYLLYWQLTPHLKYSFVGSEPDQM